MARFGFLAVIAVVSAVSLQQSVSSNRKIIFVHRFLLIKYIIWKLMPIQKGYLIKVLLLLYFNFSIRFEVLEL